MFLLHPQITSSQQSEDVCLVKNVCSREWKCTDWNCVNLDQLWGVHTCFGEGVILAALIIGHSIKSCRFNLMNLWTDVKTPTAHKNACCLEQIPSLRGWEDFKAIWIANMYGFKRWSEWGKKCCSCEKYVLFVHAARRRGPRGERHDLWQHAGPPGNLLLWMPAQLHSLSASVRTYTWLLALALQLQRVPGSLSSYHALSLVGGSNNGCCLTHWSLHVDRDAFFPCT